MSHIYIPITKRIDTFGEESKKIISRLQESPSQYLQNRITLQYESLDQMLALMNKYIEDKNETSDAVHVESIEDMVLVIIAFVKFLTVDSFKQMFDGQTYGKQCYNALNRLVKKEYITKIHKKNDKDNAFYSLTKSGKSKLDKMFYNFNILPYCAKNVKNDGFAYHDSCVGNVYLRFMRLGKSFYYTRYYYDGERKEDEVYPDALIKVYNQALYNSTYYVEGDTGTEGSATIIAKISNYYKHGYCTPTSNQYLYFVFCPQKEDYMKYICSLWTPAGIDCMIVIEQLLGYYECTLDELINKMKRHIRYPNDDLTAIYIKISGLKEDNNLVNYRLNRSLLACLLIRCLFRIPWINNLLKCPSGSNDMAKINILYHYAKNNQYSQMIQHYIDCMLNILETRDKRTTLAKSIINHLDCMVQNDNLAGAVKSIMSGVDTLFVPSCICEAYATTYSPSCCDKNIRRIRYHYFCLYKTNGRYRPLGDPIPTQDGYPDLVLRNYLKYDIYSFDLGCNTTKEIYIENISASLSAMVRIIMLVNGLVGVSCPERHITVVCLVDSVGDAVQFNKLLKHKKASDSNICLRYMLYQDTYYGHMFNFGADGHKIDYYRELSDRRNGYVEVERTLY